MLIKIIQLFITLALALTIKAVCFKIPNEQQICEKGEKNREIDYKLLAFGLLEQTTDSVDQGEAILTLTDSFIQMHLPVLLESFLIKINLQGSFIWHKQLTPELSVDIFNFKIVNLHEIHSSSWHLDRQSNEYQIKSEPIDAVLQFDFIVSGPTNDDSQLYSTEVRLERFQTKFICRLNTLEGHFSLEMKLLQVLKVESISVRLQADGMELTAQQRFYREMIEQNLRYELTEIYEFSSEDLSRISNFVNPLIDTPYLMPNGLTFDSDAAFMSNGQDDRSVILGFGSKSLDNQLTRKESTSSTFMISQKMLNQLLQEALEQGWFNKDYQIQSSLIETYLVGFEDAFGSYDSVLLRARPQLISIFMSQQSTYLDMKVEFDVQNPLNFQQSVAKLKMDFKVMLDIEVNDLEDRVVAKLTGITPNVDQYTPYFNCHIKEAAMKAEIVALKPVVAELANEIFEKGISVKDILPTWLKADLSSIDIYEDWMVFEFSEE